MPDWKLDEDLPAIVEGAQGTPGRVVTLDAVAEGQRVDIDAGCERLRPLGELVLGAQRDEFVLRVGKRNGRHIGLVHRAQFQMIGAPVGVDDQVGGQAGCVGLSRMWMRLDGAGAAFGVADHPAHGVAGGNRAGADQLFAGFQRDVGHFAGRGIDLIERAIREGIDLDGIDIVRAGRLNRARPCWRLDDVARGSRGSAMASSRPGRGLSWSGRGSGLGTSTIWTGLGGIWFDDRLFGVLSY